ncbi:50S ribosomal protein L4 [Ectothiorhodospira haloalkaliphila]|uniref:Large ribosomal subunit protein uL4 n=1 Tax=Ectothiorhodospira haloalkaliphila TaxID=421628 RepID=W8KKR8_9GAMM|nr:MULTISPECIES: 50S ribosomal protein L4 [Ectothiorhodospira]AHK79743.1 50S ribosomal protein L4 [Ectothiorhodospira haloalkaliphila]MCG5498768.1 50S ribosomal protein L4 [Ectothiorhodospira variabilis]MCG5524287.1 50S ribosomal protein L4 [Ectothiorhodospira haloalkaliphila]
MKLQVQDTQQGVDVSDAAFGRDFNETLVHQAVVAHMAGGRFGTKAQKTRAEVRGGGAKPWRQKGTGRARAGTIRSPLWRGGGKIFAAAPRDYRQKLNRKMYRAAMASIFSELVRQDRLVVVEDFKVGEPRTKALIAKLSELGLESALIVATEADGNLYLSARNLPKVDVLDVAEVNPVSLVGAEKVLITVSALKHVEGWLS